MTPLVPNSTIMSAIIMPKKSPLMKYLNSIIPNWPLLVFIGEHKSLGYINFSIFSEITERFIKKRLTSYINLTF